MSTRSLPYRKLARFFLFEHGANGAVAAEDADWLTGGVQKQFTPSQLDKFISAYSKERELAQDKLVRAGIVLDGCPLAPIHVMPA